MITDHDLGTNAKCMKIDEFESNQIVVFLALRRATKTKNKEIINSPNMKSKKKKKKMMKRV